MKLNKLIFTACFSLILFTIVYSSWLINSVNSNVKKSLLLEQSVSENLNKLKLDDAIRDLDNLKRTAYDLKSSKSTYFLYQKLNGRPKLSTLKDIELQIIDCKKTKKINNESELVNLDESEFDHLIRHEYFSKKYSDFDNINTFFLNKLRNYYNEHKEHIDSEREAIELKKTDTYTQSSNDANFTFSRSLIKQPDLSYIKPYDTRVENAAKSGGKNHIEALLSRAQAHISHKNYSDAKADMSEVSKYTNAYSELGKITSREAFSYLVKNSELRKKITS